MAKELPYFKFEPNQWENGNIQVCTHEQKGVYIDLCCMYWSRLGELSYKLAVQKVCGGNATVIDLLYEEEIIDIIDGQICIDFLNEQLEEFKNVSNQNAENARKGWEKRRKGKKKDATAKRPQSNRNAIREDKKREDKIRKEDIIERENKFRYSANTYQNQFELSLIESFCNYWTEPNHSGTKMRFEMQKTFDVKRRLVTWSNNQIKFNKNGAGNTKNSTNGSSDFFAGSTEGLF